MYSWHSMPFIACKDCYPSSFMPVHFANLPPWTEQGKSQASYACTLWWWSYPFWPSLSSQYLSVSLCLKIMRIWLWSWRVQGCSTVRRLSVLCLCFWLQHSSRIIMPCKWSSRDVETQVVGMLKTTSIEYYKTQTLLDHKSLRHRQLGPTKLTTSPRECFKSLPVLRPRTRCSVSDGALSKRCK